MRRNKRYAAVLAACLLLLAALTAPVVPAAAQASGISVLVNGQSLSLDQAPIVENGRVLVPLRGIFESLGSTVVYNAADRSIRAQRGSNAIHLTLDSTTATVDGRSVVLETPARAIGGRTLVPLRFIAESLGANVQWLAGPRQVVVTSTTAALPPSTTIPAPTEPQITVIERPMIQSVVHTAAADLKPGDVLKVTALGTPGATATFRMPGVTDAVILEEVSPGRYEGQLTITDAMQAGRFPLIVRLTRDGQEAMHQADAQVTLAGAVTVDQTPVVSITSPRPGQKISSNFTVEGTTLPNATVHLKINERARSLFGVLVTDVRTVEAQGKADAEGKFAIPVRMGDLNEGVSVSIEARAVAPSGTASKIEKVNVQATGDE